MTSTTTVPDRAFRGPGGAGAPRLAALPGVHRATTTTPHVLDTERYDTDDRRLAAAGVVLAVRRGGEPAHWRLDLPDGDAAEQLRVPLASDVVSLSERAPVPVPEQLDELVRGVVRDRAVHPAGRVRTVRTETELRDAEDRLLATVVHDDVTVATLGRSTEVEAWTAVVVRRVRADDALAVAIATRIGELGLRPGTVDGEAALDRLLRPTPRSRPRIGRKATAGAVLVDYLARQVERLATEDLRVRRDEPDAVHQLRVASRSLRSALLAYRPLLDADATAPLVDGLRELGRHLAPARDAEVLEERISTGLHSLEPELLLGRVQAQVTRHFARIAAEARADVLGTLDSEAYETLRTGLDDLVARPPLTTRAVRPARRELPAALKQNRRRVERAMEAAVSSAVAQDEAVHSARKAAKRLRYATDVARPVVGKQSGLKDLQTALGEHQDTVVARSALRELGALAHAAGENGFSFGVLYGRNAARAARIEADLPALWRAARR